MKPSKVIIFIAVFVFLLAGAYVVVSNQISNSEKAAVDAAAEMEQSNLSDLTQEPNLPDQNVQEETTIEREGNEGDASDKDDPSTKDQTATDEGTVSEPELRFMAVGDIMLGRGVGFRLQKLGSYEKAFEKVAPVLRQGDIVFANLESPITASSHSLDSNRKIVLKAKPETVSALTSAGFNLISLSNNHMLDYYDKGLFDTMAILDENHIAHAGGGKNIDEARKPAIIEKNGLKVGLLAYTDMAELVFAGDPYLSFAAGTDKSGLVPRKYETVREDVLKLRDQVDILAVSLHWGVEDSFKVSADQVEFAHKLIDDGVDLILGHHPHQFQGMEIYKGKPILYSMGNFIFDQNDPENMEGFIVDLKYKGSELSEFAAIPVRVIEKSYVEIQTGEKAARLLERQIRLNSELGLNTQIEEDKIVIK